MAFRKKIYKSTEEIWDDLDISVDSYGSERTNQGKYRQGRTPMQTFKKADRALHQKYVFESPEQGKEVT